MCKVTQLVSVELRFQTTAVWPGICALHFGASAVKYVLEQAQFRKSTPVLSNVVCGVVRVR